MSGDRNAGQNDNIKLGENSFESLEISNVAEHPNESKCVHEEIKSRLILGNACYRSFQNLSKNIKIKTYRTIILLVVLYGCETLSHTLRKKVG
jgi:hypothetical protein